MTNKNILKAFSALDADIVIGCEPSAAPVINKKKRTPIVLRLVAVAACVALLVGGVIVGTLMFNQDDEETIVKDDEIKYVLYGDFQAGFTPDFNDSENYTIDVASIDQKNFLLSNRTIIDSFADAEEEIEFNLYGTTTEFLLTRTLTTPLISSDRFAHLGIINEYRMDGKVIEVNPTTKEMQFFTNMNVDKSVDGDFTEAQAKEMSEKILVELYGEDALEYYEFDGFMNSGQDGIKTRSVLYVKKVFGYSTDDDVLIKFNAKGELITVNAKKRKTMERAEQDLTRDQIDKAIKVLKDEYSDWNISVPQLLIDSEGDYYLNAHFTMVDDNGFFIGWQAYMNVE